MSKSETIEQRLRKLERQNRRLKLSGIAGLLIVGTFVVMGQASWQGMPAAVKARSLVLVDANGATRARLFMSTIAGGPELDLYDENGKSRVMLAETANGPALVFFDEKQSSKVILNWSPFVGPELDLFGTGGKGKATLDVAAGGPQLFLNDASGTADLHVLSDGPALGLVDLNGFEANIGITDLLIPKIGETRKTSAASVVLFGKDQKVIWQAPPQD
jgi:hypothetical protein